ncbi:MAG: FAD-dependent oxidoreductase [Burkholderiaceae bacterium]|nr:FAD-dependent oxidoreductase [Burkholderiaceae bacterium]
MTTERVVIVGAGQAGGWTARTLRDEGYAGSIVLVGAEAHPPYERPPLSKEILLGESTPDALTIVDNDTLKALDIATLFNTTVVDIDKVARQVTLSTGQLLAYDKLVLCTGGRARRLPIEGIEHERVHTLRTLDDALRLKAALSNDTGHVLVIGGGWIGLEVASSARQMGCEVTIVEYADRLCQRSVAADVSETLLALHTSHKVNVLLGTHVLGASPSETGINLILSNEQTLSFTHVIVAAGLIANDELAQQAGLVCDNGIHVDDRCLTSDPDIYAAGDVAITETAPGGIWTRLESWQNAQDQGIAVAHSILSHDLSYRPTPMLWSQQYDHFIQVAGHVNSATKTVLRQLPNGGSLRFYLDADNTTLGVIGMNAGRDFRFARQLIERGANVLPEDLADANKPLNRLAASAIIA